LTRFFFFVNIDIPFRPKQTPDYNQLKLKRRWLDPPEGAMGLIIKSVGSG
jgi:hypothetical protein